MRQFVPDGGLDKDGCIRVGGEKFHYLSAVLRLEEGDMIHVRLPSGQLQPMTVAHVDGQSRVLTLSLAGKAAGEPSIAEAGRPRFRFHLFQFVPKPPKMDLIIRQATECGVSSIIPVAGEFCQKGNIESASKKSSPSDSRWQKVITEAREQSGSPVNTEVIPCMKLGEALSFWENLSGQPGQEGGGPAKMAFVLYERDERTLPVHSAVAHALARCFPLKSGGENADIAVMVGAEGGISPSELERAGEAGFIPVHLQTNILRCETAALYGLAALQDALVESDIWKLNE